MASPLPSTLQMHPETGYEEGETLRISSEYGVHKFKVVLSEDIRPNCVVITNNTIGVNYLTPSILSEGETMPVIRKSK